MSLSLRCVKEVNVGVDVLVNGLDNRDVIGVIDVIGVSGGKSRRL
jgi:hypothetical protein